MKSIDFTDYPNERCLINRSEDTIIYIKYSTGFMAVASVDNGIITVDYNNEKGETVVYTCL